MYTRGRVLGGIAFAVAVVVLSAPAEPQQPTPATSPFVVLEPLTEVAVHVWTPDKLLFSGSYRGPRKNAGQFRHALVTTLKGHTAQKGRRAWFLFRVGAGQFTTSEFELAGPAPVEKIIRETGAKAGFSETKKGPVLAGRKALDELAKVTCCAKCCTQDCEAVTPDPRGPQCVWNCSIPAPGVSCPPVGGAPGTGDTGGTTGGAECPCDSLPLCQICFFGLPPFACQLCEICKATNPGC